MGKMFSQPQQPEPEREPVPAPQDQVARASRDAARRKNQARARYGAGGANLVRKTRAAPSLASGLYEKGPLG